VPRQPLSKNAFQHASSDSRDVRPRRTIAGQLIADNVQKSLSGWPPLSNEQRLELSALARPALAP
jgi:hypothetical protein